VSAPVPANRKYRILCIDDEEVGLRIRKLLLDKAGYDTDTATSGAIGIKKFQESSYDAVLLDYFMPQMKGDEVARHLKSLQVSTPIVMLSAHLEIEHFTEGLVDAFVRKGEDPTVLFNTLEKLFAAGPA
jgi:CheY-like chemotaxis protein